MTLAWGLRPKLHLAATWAQKMYQALSPEPSLQFCQTGPHFFQNHEINSLKLYILVFWGTWFIPSLYNIASALYIPFSNGG